MRLSKAHTLRLSFIVIVFFITTLSLGIPPVGNRGKLVDSTPRVGYLQHISFKSNLLKSVDLEPEDIELIKQYSNEYDVDYRLVIALIKQESQFDKEAVSERGAVGLMQIMPVTGAEVTEQLQLDNTHLLGKHLNTGIYYYSRLLELFQNCPKVEQISLALAAYNAGPSRIYDAQELAAYMGENPNSWASVRKVLPLLSKRYYSLHQAVWGSDKPKNGYFGSWRQTIMFVDNIMDTYQEYQRDGN